MPPASKPVPTASKPVSFPVVSNSSAPPSVGIKPTAPVKIIASAQSVPKLIHSPVVFQPINAVTPQSLVPPQVSSATFQYKNTNVTIPFPQGSYNGQFGPAPTKVEIPSYTPSQIFNDVTAPSAPSAPMTATPVVATAITATPVVAAAAPTATPVVAAVAPTAVPAVASSILKASEATPNTPAWVYIVVGIIILLILALLGFMIWRHFSLQNGIDSSLSSLSAPVSVPEVSLSTI
jgi:uncharacterized integral membrane protein